MAGSNNSEFDIVSMALISIGEGSISSYSGTFSGSVAEDIYPITRDALLTDYRWRFASSKVALSRLVDTPLNEWQYAFQLPNDLLLLQHVYPNIDYEIYANYLYTNATTIEIDYIYRPNESDFPAYFVKALSYALATELSMAITNSQTIQKTTSEMAVRYLIQARYKDSQGRPQTPIQNKPWIQVRK